MFRLKEVKEILINSLSKEKEEIFATKKFLKDNLYKCSNFDTQNNLTTRSKYTSYDIEILFENHFDKFKPTLDQIKNFNTKSLRSKSDTDIFFQKDFLNLFSDCTKEKRYEYCRNLEGPKVNTGALENFDRILYNDQEKYNIKYILEECAQYLNNCSAVYLKQIIHSSQAFHGSITKHPEYQLVVEKIEQSLEKLNEKDLNFLLNNLEKNEFFSLTIFEPYLLSILTIPIFLSIFYPLHAEGAFKKVLSDAIKNQLVLKTSFNQKLINFTNRSLDYIKIIEPLFIKVNKMINYSPIIRTSVGTTIFGFCSKQLYEIYIKIKQPTLIKPEAITIKPGTITKIVEKELEKGQGLESEAIDKSIKIISKIAFDAGRLWISPASNFLRGLMYGAKDNIKDVAKIADDQLSNPDSIMSKKIEELKEKKRK